MHVAYIIASCIRPLSQDSPSRECPWLTVIVCVYISDENVCMSVREISASIKSIYKRVTLLVFVKKYNPCFSTDFDV